MGARMTKSELERRIEGDLRDALRREDAIRTSVLRLVIAAIRNKEIEKRGRGDSSGLTETEVMQALAHEAKKRKEAADAFGRGARPELVRKENEELAIIQEYLPPPLGRDEIERVVEAVLAREGAREFGPIMKMVMRELKGRGDGALVAAVLKEKLGS